MSTTSDKLNSVRKPRVHIKYDVETEGGIEEKELPFVVGVMGDYAGNQPGEKPAPLKERKFVQVDQDNFDQVMANQQPGVAFHVENTLDNGESEMRVNLQFNSLRDFEPDQVVEKVPALKKLKDARDQLQELLTKADRSDQLEELLEDILQSSDQLSQLAGELKQETE